MVDPERRAAPWPDWSITTRIDARSHVDTVWRAIQCHRTQVAIYGELSVLAMRDREALYGERTFYRVFSTVNGGHETETDLFAELREQGISR